MSSNPIVAKDAIFEGVLPLTQAAYLPDRAYDEMIAADGSVQDAKFLQGSLVFARSAIEAVRQWRFKPYLFNGRATAARTQLTLNFLPPA